MFWYVCILVCEIYTYYIYLHSYHTGIHTVLYMCNTQYHTHNALQHNATRCNTLQHTATHCNTLQHIIAYHRRCDCRVVHVVAVCCNVALFCCSTLQLFFDILHVIWRNDTYIMPQQTQLQHSVAACCSVLQCAVVSCRVLQRVAVCCSVL